MIYNLEKPIPRFTLLISLILACLLACTARLQAMEVVQVEPAKIRLNIPPGGSKTGTIKVYNLSSDSKTIKAYFEDWVYLPICDGTKNFSPAGTTALSAAKWITFYPTDFTIPAYGKQIVSYTVKVPADSKGGHYAVLFFENYIGDSKAPSGGVNVNLAVRVASLFYIETEGTVKRQASIENLKISKKEGNKLQITAEFRNTGNVDIATKSNYFLIDNKGKVYARGDFNDLYAFPGDAAILSSSWNDIIAPGEYDLVFTINIGRALEEARVGKVPAITKEAVLELGQNNEVINVGGFK